MINAALLFNLAGLHTVATMSPGPNFALVVQEAATAQTRRHVLWVVLGVVTGIYMHGFLGLWGVNIVFSKYPFALTAARIFGAGFLLYLGYKSLIAFAKMRSKSSQNMGIAEANASEASTTDIGSFWRGLSTCILNPKAFLYFASVFPQVVTSQMSLSEMFLTPLLLSMITFSWFSILGFTVHHLADSKHLATFRSLMLLGTGLIFIGLGGSTLIALT